MIERLIGAWDLREWSEIRSDGSKSYPLGEDAIGQILYTPDGRMAAQLVRINRQKFASDDWRKADPAEAARAFKEYFGYFGLYEVDLGSKTVIHHVKGSWFPNVEGGDQFRRFRLEGGLLVLDADTSWGKVRIVWARPDAN
jgi:Lipocalin-like domain